jgi:hypothetical protein
VYNQLRSAPNKASPEYRSAARRALRALRRAAAADPADWQAQLLAAKCARKLGHPPESYLESMARACRLAAMHEGGLIDPLHALHAARLRLLLPLVPRTAQGAAAAEPAPAATSPGPDSAPPGQLLRLLAKHCFLPEAQRATAEAAGAAAAPGAGPAEVAAAVELLWADCEAAMRWCTEKSKGYHRAHHM